MHYKRSHTYQKLYQLFSHVTAGRFHMNMTQRNFSHKSIFHRLVYINSIENSLKSETIKYIFSLKIKLKIDKLHWIIIDWGLWHSIICQNYTVLCGFKYCVKEWAFFVHLKQWFRKSSCSDRLNGRQFWRYYLANSSHELLWNVIDSDENKSTIEIQS